MNKENNQCAASCAEQVAYKLMHDLLAQIKNQQSDFDAMTDQYRQQYILDLFVRCLDATKSKGLQPVPEIGHKHI